MRILIILLLVSGGLNVILLTVLYTLWLERNIVDKVYDELRDRKKVKK